MCFLSQFYKELISGHFQVVASPIFPYSHHSSGTANAMNDQILTLKEVAAYLKLAEKTAYKLAADGKLPGFKVGGSWRFKREDVENWIDEQKMIGKK